MRGFYSLATLLVGGWLACSGPAVASGDDCLECHGQADLTNETGHSVHVDGQAQQHSVHAGLSCTDCHDGITDYPHPAHVALPRCADCHDEAASHVAGSVHGDALGDEACADCHGGAHVARAPNGPPGSLCESCHPDVVGAYRGSVHAAQLEGGGAACRSCHGPAHDMLAAADPGARVAKANLPDTCGACHANPNFLARHAIPMARPVEAYRLSVHGRAVAAGNDEAASCSDCHGSHDILPERDPRSRINHWAVARTCGGCHGAIAKAYADSIHGQATARGVRDAPVCTDCHGEHAILAPSEPNSLVNPARVSTTTCGHCHSDERLERKFNLPRDKVPSFEDSYHGLALRAGSLTVANCASCHGVHDILPSSDRRSTVNPANLAKTCGKCHPGAGSRFKVGPVHVRSESASENVVVRVIRLAYVFLIIPFTLGFMALHNALDFLIKLIRPAHRESSGEEVPRMALHFRIAHALVVVSFPTLVYTGFALKFPGSWWAAPLLAFEGQVDVRGLVHRGAAVVLLLALVYHLVHLLLVRRDRRILGKLWPRVQDLRDLLAMLRHNLGARVARPRFHTFSYAEKAEYWAFMWGTVVMAASGFVLWFNNLTLEFLPKWVSDAATALHYYEAILATFSILIWHFYMVIFDPDVYPMDRSWLTGKTSADHLRHTRPEYYREIVERESSGREGPEGDGTPAEGDTGRSSR